jgi:hypothetical protein
VNVWQRACGRLTGHHVSQSAWWSTPNRASGWFRCADCRATWNLAVGVGQPGKSWRFEANGLSMREVIRVLKW